MEGEVDSTMAEAAMGSNEAVTGRRYYAPTSSVLHGEPVYWGNMMNSRYATELNLIYGVAGSKYVGYHPHELLTGASNLTNNQPPMTAEQRSHAVLENQFPYANVDALNNSSGAFGGSVLGYGHWEAG